MIDIYVGEFVGSTGLYDNVTLFFSDAFLLPSNS